MDTRNMQNHAQEPRTHQRRDGAPRCVTETGQRPTNHGCAAAGRSIRRMVSLEHALHNQVRNLRMALSDLKIQVSDLAAAYGRE
jgi:hypothetical protein